jgi:O-antigen/teichoic acid export membrane protein
LLSQTLFLSTLAMAFGYPMLSPIGKAKVVNTSNIVASVAHIAQIVILAAAGKLTVVNVCVAVVITKTIFLLYRLTAVYKYRHLFVNKEECEKI